MIEVQAVRRWFMIEIALFLSYDNKIQVGRTKEIRKGGFISLLETLTELKSTFGQMPGAYEIFYMKVVLRVAGILATQDLVGQEGSLGILRDLERIISRENDGAFW